MSLLKQNTTRKGLVNENATKLEAGDSKEYKVEAIWDSVIFARKSESGHLPGLYYLLSWKGYPEEENTWEPILAVQHLRKLISSFHKDHPNKPTATSEPIDTASPMAKPIVKPPGPPKQKWDQPANSSNKQTKKTWAAFGFYRILGLFLRCG